MKTKKTLRAEKQEALDKLLDLNAKHKTQTDQLADAQKENREAAELIEKMDIFIKTLAKDNDCTGCDFADHHRPQKCQSCRRGAKDLYTPAVPTNL